MVAWGADYEGGWCLHNYQGSANENCGADKNIEDALNR